MGELGQFGHLRVNNHDTNDHKLQDVRDIMVTYTRLNSLDLKMSFSRKVYDGRKRPTLFD